MWLNKFIKLSENSCFILLADSLWHYGLQASSLLCLSIHLQFWRTEVKSQYHWLGGKSGRVWPGLSPPGDSRREHIPYKPCQLLMASGITWLGCVALVFKVRIFKPLCSVITLSLPCMCQVSLCPPFLKKKKLFIFLTQRLNLGLLHCRQFLYHPSHHFYK